MRVPCRTAPPVEGSLTATRVDSTRARDREAVAGRTAPGQRRAGAPAAAQEDRPGCLLLRRHLLHGLRLRGDPVRGGPGRLQPGPRPAHAGAHRPGRGSASGHRGHLVPPDDLRLPERRRLLRGEPREPGRLPLPRRRRFPVDRLHPHSGRLDIGRRGRHHLDPHLPGHRPPAGAPRPGPDRGDHPGQPPGDQGVRPDLRHPDLRLHRGPVPPGRLGPGPGVLRRHQPGRVRPRAVSRGPARPADRSASSSS